MSGQHEPGTMVDEPPPDIVAWEELVVVKLGATTLDDNDPILAEVAQATQRRSIVLVHGGGRVLTEWLDRLGIASRFETGLRVTDDAALEVAQAVYGGIVNGELVAALNRLGVPAVGLTGVDGRVLVAHRAVELGRVARVIGARPAVLYALLAGGFVPVIAPLAADEQGLVCNVNADEAAAGLAGALGARLLLLTDTAGVLDASGQPLATLDELAAEQLITEGVIRDGMLPKVNGALAALRSGSPEVVIADGRARDALHRALDDHSFGTRLLPLGAGDG